MVMRNTIDWFVGAGIAVIPVAFQSKSPVQKWKKFQATLPSAGQLDNWFPANRKVNWGVVAGWQNLVIVDFDDAGAYGKWRAYATERGGQAAHVARNAYQVTTARGVHVYIRTRDAERNRKLPGIDVKARNGYVLGAGSVHPSGAIYTAMRENIYIPLVGALSEILPPDLLALDTAMPDNVTIPSANLSGLAPKPVVSDPWDAATLSADVRDGKTIDRIKARFSIDSLFTGKEQTGANYFMVRCPLHDDGSPSMWVDTARGMCGCFAGCTSKPLDVINLFARIRGITNQDAINQMAAML